MARINRTELLKSLVAVSPGLSASEIIEQSSSFAFDGTGRVFCFNDEVAASIQSPLMIKGAVVGKELLAYLGKLTEEELDVEQTDGELIIKVGRKKAGIRVANDVLLPIDAVERPTEWTKLPEKFIEAVGLASTCCGNDQTKFMTTCVHIHPDHVEASDDFQFIRYPLKTGLDIPTLIRQKALSGVLGMDVTELSGTENWMHFRNPAGLTLSCRRYASKFPDLSKFLEMEDGKKTVLPKELGGAVEKAEIFSKVGDGVNTVLIELKAGKMRLTGRGANGYSAEVLDAAFDGELSFSISPKLLLEVMKKGSECLIGQGRLKVETPAWRWVTATRVVVK